MNVNFGDDRLPRRFWDKVRVDKSGCWLWTGATMGGGYGVISFDGANYTAHRVSRSTLCGDCSFRSKSRTLDQIDHMCNTPACVNPAHLDPVDAKTNTYRSNAASAINAAKTECSNCGSSYTLTSNGRRICRPCKAATARARRMVSGGAYELWRANNKDRINAKARAAYHAALEQSDAD